MDKNSRFEFQQSIQTYFEEYKVYETFQNLMKQLIVHKPEKPLEFLIDQIQNNDPSKSNFARNLI